MRELAGAAGAHVQIGAKSTDTDLVTSVDRAAERWLIDRLARRRPDDAVLGEEDGERPGTSGVRWVLDPIDGTVNFVLGIPAYAVSVAAEVDGTGRSPGRSATSRPARCSTPCSAAERAGDGTALAGPRDVPLARAVIGTGFGYDARPARAQGAVAARLLPRIGDLRRIGAASLDLCNVACGRLDGYFEAGLNLWDHAAGALIAREAGCVVSGLGGRAPSERMVAAAGAGTRRRPVRAARGTGRGRVGATADAGA